MEYFPRMQYVAAQRISQEEFFFMSLFNDISCGSKDNEKECLANAKLVSLYAKRFGKGQRSFIGPGSEKKWYSISQDCPQGVWDNMAERMLLEFAESGCPIFRATSPLSRGLFKSKGNGKLSTHYSADLETSKTHTRSSDDSKSLNVELVHERTRRLVVEKNTENAPDGCQTRSCHESIRFNVGDETLRDRSGQPVVNHDESGHEQTMLNEVNMDFRIPGLPQSVVKHAHSTSVRELIQKIENHPDRHALQQDLRQKTSLQPVQSRVKADDSGRGQHRIV